MLKNKTLQELIDLFNQVCEELERRRYFEAMTASEFWHEEVEPGTLVPFKELYKGEELIKKVIEALDEKEEHLQKYPMLRAYEHLIINRE